MATFNRVAWDAMCEAEATYLKANGWFHYEQLGDSWENEEQDRFGVTQGHAVNIQKQLDRNFARAKQAPADDGSLTYLSVIEHKPFDPIGSLYESVFNDYVQRGLAVYGTGGYNITEKGREVLRVSRVKQEPVKEDL